MERNYYAAAVVSYVINRVAERIRGTRVSKCLTNCFWRATYRESWLVSFEDHWLTSYWNFDWTNFLRVVVILRLISMNEPMNSDTISRTLTYSISFSIIFVRNENPSFTRSRTDTIFSISGNNLSIWKNESKFKRYGKWSGETSYRSEVSHRALKTINFPRNRANTLDQALFMYQSINVEAFSLHRGPWIASSRLSFDLSVVPTTCSPLTQARIDRKKSTTVFIRCSPLNVIINLGSNNANVFSFFFFSRAAFLNTPLCRARARKRAKMFPGVARRHRSRRFSFRTAVFPNRSASSGEKRQPRMQIKIFPRRNSGWKLVFPNRADATRVFLASSCSPNFSFGIRLGIITNGWTRIFGQ